MEIARALAGFAVATYILAVATLIVAGATGYRSSHPGRVVGAGAIYLVALPLVIGLVESVR